MHKRESQKLKHIMRVFFCCVSFFSLTLHATPPNETQLAVWANEAIVATYTFNYQNFLERQKEIAAYFSAQTWIAYSKALNDSKLPETIQKNAYFVNAVAMAPPEIKNPTANQWVATMPLLIQYKNPQYQQTQTLLITMDFKVAPARQGVRGFVINGFNAKVTTPACKCSPNNTP